MAEPIRNRNVSNDANQPTETLSPTEARQGRPGYPVLMVLAAGLILAGIAWAGAELWGERIDTDKTPTATTTTTTPSGETGSAQTGAQPGGAGTFDNNPGDGSTPATGATDRDPTAQSGTGGESQQTSPDGTVK